MDERIKFIDRILDGEKMAALYREFNISRKTGYKINLSQVFAGQTVGIKQTDEQIWLVSFMDHDPGYFDDEICRLEPLLAHCGPKCYPCVRYQM